MAEWLPRHEPALRMGMFVGVFALMALWEILAGRRQLRHSLGRRWWANLGLSAVDSISVRLLFPAAATGFAFKAQNAGWGLLQAIDWPLWAEITITIVVLDLATYGVHILFHAVPALWRLHRVHHADEDVDASTGIRFHPVEILVSLAFKAAVIAGLGASPVGVLLFAVVLNAMSMFNHGNVRLGRFDGVVRWLLVTPDMHRVHHSVELDESNSNFGFNLSWWDRLFGTYRSQPRGGHEAMRLGVESLPAGEPRGLLALLALPFIRRRPPSE